MRLVSLDLGLHLGIEGKDLRLTCDLQNNDLIQPLPAVTKYMAGSSPMQPGKFQTMQCHLCVNTYLWTLTRSGASERSSTAARWADWNRSEMVPPSTKYLMGSTGVKRGHKIVFHCGPGRDMSLLKCLYWLENFWWKSKIICW